MRKDKAVGCDPGLKNFGFSVVYYNKYKQRVIHTHMIKNTVTSLKENVLEQRLAFYKEIEPYLIKYKPKHLVVERFMTRGRFGQAIGECLTFMLSTLADLCQKHGIIFHSIASATWKNAFQRSQGKKLDSLYKFLKPLPNHVVDSVLQATYCLDPTYKYWKTSYLKAIREKWLN